MRMRWSTKVHMVQRRDNDEGLQGWKVGRLEGWKVGRLEGWRVGELKG
eukprot:CAMPEP_0181395808 /NCGR_PEP_ID=MMETSP1106-20121128/28545_1 /TAXON_ID=81844 /ORGANISM="Mantoniella antarctica, Strain SL-175" /LENGTH=47 /DNA_ID= /DNA_START= /DNA_END= /DNA_ORIENTATION=